MRFSKLISFVFHPIFIPIIVIYFGLNRVEIIEFLIFHKLNALYLIVVLFTLILPSFFSVILLKLKMINSLEMKTIQERRFPLSFSLISMIIGYIFLHKLFEFMPIVLTIYLGYIFLIFCSLLISQKWKISLHMIGIGGATGSFFALHSVYGGLFYLTLFFFFCSGVLAFARIKEKAHTELQVYIGFLLGIFVEIIFILNHNFIIETTSILRSNIASML